MEAPSGWIKGVEFPATKYEVIDAASDADAPQEVVERLQQLTQEHYDSRQQIEAELAGDQPV